MEHNVSVIPIGSATKAHKAARLLGERFIDARVVSGRTCGYAVEVDKRQYDAALNILRGSGMKV